MKNFLVAVVALIMNAFLFSCTSDSIADKDTLYETQATEGDDGDPITPPPPGG